VNLARVDREQEEGESFDSSYKNLSNPEKHAIITRLENNEYNLRIRNDESVQKWQELLLNLKTDLYGVDEDGYPDSLTKTHLEEELFKT